MIGSFLYYARSLDSTMLPALNEILSSQAKITQYIKKECQQIIDYSTTYLDVYIYYHASNIVLLVDSDATYLVMPNAKSWIDRYFQLNNDLNRITYPNINGTILIEYKTLKHIVSSAVKVETVGIFHNA